MNIAKQFNCLPSEVMHIQDEYTAFCFNEACANLLARLEAGENPHYKETQEEVEIKQEYKNFSDFYKDVGGK